MPKTTEKYDRATNFLLSKENKDHLDKLADKMGMQMAPCIRHIIEAAFRHSVLGIPHCADAQGCRCPQFFAAPLLPADSGIRGTQL